MFPNDLNGSMRKKFPASISKRAAITTEIGYAPSGTPENISRKIEASATPIRFSNEMPKKIMADAETIGIAAMLHIPVAPGTKIRNKTPKVTTVTVVMMVCGYIYNLPDEENLHRDGVFKRRGYFYFLKEARLAFDDMAYSSQHQAARVAISAA